MEDSTGYGSYFRVIFLIFVGFVFASSGYEIIAEFAAGERLSAMLDDLFRFFISTLVLGVFAFEYFSQRRALHDLRGQLKNARGRLAELDARSQELGSQYRLAMQRQFDVWELTASEQDVVIMLLKGLSFREISGLRETREKTVRQQASSVYRKAGLANRHELAAWFFEDILEPEPIK